MAAPRSSSDLAVRRKMRKGTHSCFECRRRKIRCIFSPDNSSVCTECFARGSRCIDQEHASPEAIVDHRKNLRERVSRLEALVGQLLEDKTDRGAAETLNALKERPYPATPLSGDAASQNANGVTPGNENAPLMSMFDNDVLSRAESEVSEQASVEAATDGHRFSSGTTANGTTIDFHCDGGGGLNNFFVSPAANEKHERTRRALLATLPPLPKILELFQRNGSWWLAFRSKCPGTTTRYKDLMEFTNHAYTKGTPQQLGLLTLAFAISFDGDEIDQYLSLVDRWILQDDEYASSLEGMECLILQAKCFADIGQPRKAWLLYRRGLTFAQLLGLHRNHSMSPERDSIWWVLYAGDRFMSLLLGLPYGIADVHCDLELKGLIADHSSSHVVFLTGVAMMAGKVIDRCQGMAQASLSSALDLDAQLDEIAAKVPEGWWELEPLIADSHREKTAVELRERVLTQIGFHQVRCYLHLPFLLKSAANPRFEYSRTTCLSSSREMLRLYQFLRTGNGGPIYECKAVDFIGFTASILILLGLLGYGRMSPVHDPKQEEADWRMIEITMDILRRASSEKGGKVAAQSYKVLEQLSQVRHVDNLPQNEEYSAKIVIPYFGTISVRRGQNFNPKSTKPTTNMSKNSPISAVTSNSPQSSSNLFVNPASTNAHHFPTPPLSTHSGSTPTGTTHSSPQQPLSNDPFIAYDGFYMPTSGFDQASQHIDDDSGILNFGAPTAQWGMAMPMGLGAGQMDIDQDWSMFLDQSVGAAGNFNSNISQPGQGQQHLQAQTPTHSYFALG